MDCEFIEQSLSFQNVKWFTLLQGEWNLFLQRYVKKTIRYKTDLQSLKDFLKLDEAPALATMDNYPDDVQLAARKILENMRLSACPNPHIFG